MSKMPPTHKWLVEKRAHLQGMLEHKTQMLELTLARLEPKLAKLRADVDALDRALCVYDASLAGTGVKPVNPWQGDYGPRGALKEFVKGALRERGQLPIQTDDLAALIVERFALTFDLPGNAESVDEKHGLGRVARSREGRPGRVAPRRSNWLRRPVALEESAAHHDG